MYNFHNHSYRCNHASGTDEDYVLEAIKNGYDTMGFSDHAPYKFPPKHKSGFRIPLDQAEDYVNSVNELKEKYSGMIDIKLGFEVEYYPELIEDELEYLSAFKYDYIILGQHFTDNEYEPHAHYSGTATDKVTLFEKYISQVLLAAKSGKFTYIAHPDLFKFTGDKEIYISKMRYMLTRLKEYDIPLEFNFLGFTDKRNYPNMDFWKLVKEIGNPVVIGLDAHNPKVYEDKENLAKAKQVLADLGITPLEEIKLIAYNEKR